MKLGFLISLALFCFNGFITGVHLPLNDFKGVDLIISEVHGNTKIDKRGNDRVLKFNGNNGPNYIKYMINDNTTNSVDSCFKTLSHCHDFKLKFWFKFSTNTTKSKLILRHGPDNNREKGLNVIILSDNHLRISHDNGKLYRIAESKYLINKWNFVTILSTKDNLNVEINGINTKSISKASQFDNNELSQESLLLGFENIEKGSEVSFDDYKLEIPNNIQGVIRINSDSTTKLKYNGRNHIQVNFKNKIKTQSDREELDITFKFPEDFTSGLIWYSEKGDEKSFVYLKESRLYYVYIFKQIEKEARLRTTEEITIPDVLPPNTYHRLVIQRFADRLTLTVNEVLRAKKTIVKGSIPMLIPGGTVYVGGHSNPTIVTEGRVHTQFKGEINEVILKGDKHKDFNLFEVLDKEDWKTNILNRGRVEVTIQPNDNSNYGSHLISEFPVPITFKQFENLIRLDPWNFDEFQSIEMEFRTKEPKGVLFFVGPSSGHTDYVCLEFFDRNLYFAFGIDGKDYRVRMNNLDSPVTTGKFHRVFIKRNRFHNFTATLDNVNIPIEKSSGHQKSFGTYTYIGGIDSPSRLPWYVWSRSGFVGCINYIRVNNDKYIDPRGKNNQYSGEIAGLEIGGKCLDDIPSCTASRCAGGKCYDRTYPFTGEINFFCDCSGTTRTYKTPIDNIMRSEVCERETEELTSKGTSFYVVDFKNEDSKNRMMKTHWDDIAISFKTQQSTGTIFRTYRTKPNLYFTLELENGYLNLKSNINDLDNTGRVSTFTISRGGLNDNRWHTVYIKRRAEFIRMWVDDKSTMVKGRIPVISKTFDNAFEYILIGSNNLETNDVKMIGSFRNFYWNEFDFLGTRRLVGTYRGTIKTPKTVDPPLPPYPRDPPVQCTMTSEHKWTQVTDVVTNEEEVGFFIEFKTRYSGVIWHAYDEMYPTGRYLTLLVIGDRLILAYRLNEDQKVVIIEDGSRFRCSDNNWHRVTIMIHKTLKRITVLSDKDINPVNLYLALNRPLEFNKMSFYFGGMPDGFYRQVFTQLRLSYPNLAEKIALYKDSSLTGCLGDFLTSGSNFKRNLLSSARKTYPINTLDCSGCKNPMKCTSDFCLNGGICQLSPIGRAYCNCSSTGYIGDKCETRQPRCPPNFCLNGGRCFLYQNEPRCDCTNTGYRGDRCQESHCSSTYCYNGGRCQIVSGRPSCDCTNTKYTGPLCNKAICPNDYCLNGGRCILDNNRDKRCDCLGTGYTGLQCERAICRNDYCLNGGTCVPRNGKPTCDCPMEYVGAVCEKTLCSSDYCYNGGECYVFQGNQQCRCGYNFEGERCEVVKRCPPNYCLYGGICSMINGKATCDCSRTNYEGDRCLYPKQCPNNYCENNGRCIVEQGEYKCECGNNYSGDRCQNKKECPRNFCANNGICKPLGNQFICECVNTGYSGKRCNDNSRGILTNYVKDGYAIYNINNPKSTTTDSITLGFQTYMSTGTIATFKTIDGKYWSLKVMDGKLVVDQNGVLSRLKNNVNDGSYHVVNIKRNNGVLLLTVHGTNTEYTNFEATSLVDSNQSLMYKQIIIGANQNSQDQFKGAIGGIVYDKKYLMEEIELNPNLRYGDIEIINVPYSLQRPPTQCPLNYCSNNGICVLIDYQPICRCENTGFFGNRCTKQTYGIFPKPKTRGGYMILNIDPPRPTNKDEMKVLIQTLVPNNPVARFELSDGFYEIKMIGGQLYLLTSKNQIYPLTDDSRLDNGNPYLLTFERLNNRIIFKVNGQQTQTVDLSDMTSNGGFMIHNRIILGADKQLTKYFTGAIGGFEWNGMKMISKSGGTTSGTTKNGEVDIILMPKLNVTVVPPTKVKKPIPDVVIGALHGGVVWSADGTSIFVPGVGIGGGAIVPAGIGPQILGAGSVVTVLPLNPLVAGLILATLLFLSSLLWACWRCKPGCCPCCAGLTKGAPSAAALRARILTPIQAASMSTGGAGGAGAGGSAAAAAKTGEKSFWSRMKTTVTTVPPPHGEIYEASGYKTENIALLSPNGIGNGYHASSRDERYNRTIGGSMHSLPVRGGANMLDVNDYRFGTMGQGSIMRIDTTHHEIDADAGPNVFSGEEMKVDCCVLSHNSRYAVTGSEVGPPQVWDMQTGELCKVMDGMEFGATDLHLACGDTILVGLVADDVTDGHGQRRLKRLQMWDFASGTQIAMPGDIMSSATVVNNNGSHLIMNRETVDYNGIPTSASILRWDIAANQPVQEIHYDIPAHMNHEGVTFLKISPNDRMVVAGFTGVDDQAHYMVFDLAASYPQGVVVQPLMMSIDAKTCATEIIGPEEAITGTKKGELIVWNLRNAKPVRQILLHATLEGNVQTKLNPHKDAINCVALSNNGEYLVTGSADKTVNVYTMADERLIHSLEGHADDVLSVVISNDNEIIVSGSWDGSMRVWKLATGDPMCWFTSNIEILQVKLTNDKKAIVALGERMGMRKLIMLQIIRNKSRRTRHTDNTIGSPIHSPTPFSPAMSH